MADQIGIQDIEKCPWCLRGIPFPAYDAHVRKCRDYHGPHIDEGQSLEDFCDAYQRANW